MSSFWHIHHSASGLSRERRKEKVREGTRKKRELYIDGLHEYNFFERNVFFEKIMGPFEGLC